MKPILLVLLCCLLTATACARTPLVTKVDFSKNGNGNDSTIMSGTGLYYYLPQTIIKIDVPMTLECKKTTDPKINKGKYVENKKFGIAFQGITFTTEGLFDPQQIYYVNMPDQAFMDFSLSLSRSEDGQLYTIGAAAIDRQLEVVKKLAVYGTAIGAAWVTGGLSAALPVVSDDAAALEKKTLPNNSDQDEKNIKSDRNAVPGVHGKLKDFGASCQGESATYPLTFYVNPFDSQVAAQSNDNLPAVLELPIAKINTSNGHIWYLTSPYDVVKGTVDRHIGAAADPDAYKKVAAVEFERWLKDHGPGTALGKDFIFLKIEPVDSLGSRLAGSIKADPPDGQGYYYREPGLARVSVLHGKDVLGSAVVSVAQYGKVLALPRGYGSKAASTDIVLFKATGAIKSVAINSTARSGSETKDAATAIQALLNIIQTQSKPSSTTSSQ